jgi:hypothetical protein
MRTKQVKEKFTPGFVSSSAILAAHTERISLVKEESELKTSLQIGYL